MMNLQKTPLKLEIRVYLFSPLRNPCPLSLSAKSWEFSCQVDIKNTSKAYQVSLGVYRGERAINALKCSTWGFIGEEFETKYGQTESYAPYTNKYEKVTKDKNNYIKLTYNAQADKFTSFYSKNGIAWTNMGFFSIQTCSATYTFSNILCKCI